MSCGFLGGDSQSILALMSSQSLIFLAGLIVLVLPFLGVPNSIDRWIFAGIGAGIVIVGYRLRRAAYFRSLETGGGERRADAFVENPHPSKRDESEHA